MRREIGFILETLVGDITQGSTSPLTSDVELVFWNGLGEEHDGTPTVILQPRAFILTSFKLGFEDAVRDVLVKLGCKIRGTRRDQFLNRLPAVAVRLMEDLAEIAAAISLVDVGVGRHEGPRFRVSFRSFCGRPTVGILFFGIVESDTVSFASGGATFEDALETTIAKALMHLGCV